MWGRFRKRIGFEPQIRLVPAHRRHDIADEKGWSGTSEFLFEGSSAMLLPF